MTVLAAAVRRVRHAAWAVWVSPRLLGGAERVLLPGRRTRPAPADGAPHVLVGPPGGGNIGDQAMVEAFVESVDGPVVVVADAENALRVPDALAHKAEVRVLPALVYGGGLPHLRDVLRLERLLDRSRSVSVVGADLMDGGYGHRGAVTLARILRRAARSGVPSRVIGFSWGAAPHPRARQAMARASRAGTRLLVRDPVSAVRARADGLHEVTEVADVAFSGTLVEEPRGVGRDLPRSGHVVVNVSGLIQSRRDVVQPFTDLVRQLRGTGREVVLLPHVRRPGGDDVAACRLVAASFTEDDGVHLVDAVLRPAQVRHVVGGADLVVTGRMHLAVLGLSQGVPAVCLATQGKVEGLMRLVGTPELCVEPDDDLGRRLPLVVADALADATLSARVASRLGHVRSLSRRNASGLRAGDPTRVG